MNKNNVIIKGHKGTWYCIDSLEMDDKMYYLMESEIYGEDAPAIILDAEGNVVMEDIHNGFEDFIERLEEQNN